MTSEQIQYTQLGAMESEIETPEKTRIVAMLEIAYQLAKLNEHFEAVDNAVFGGKSK